MFFKKTNKKNEIPFLTRESALISLSSYQFCNKFSQGRRLLVSCVPMREQKKMRKGTFFRAGQCAALPSFRVGKMLFFVGKGYVITNFTKGCRSKRVRVLIY